MIRKEFEVFSFDEAVAAAEKEGFHVIKNKTMSWKNAGSPVSDKELKVFAVDQLTKERLTNVPGAGFMIIVKAGSADTRERPYAYENITTDGRIKTERTYEWTRNDTGEVVLSTTGTKDEAIKAAKEIMSEVKADMTLTVVYRVKEGKDVIGRLTYTPSKNTESGRYLFIGNSLDI